MEKKHILYNTDAYIKLQNGIFKTLKTLSGSFGPIGRLVAIEKGKDRSPQLTNDGITIAQSLSLPCPFENLGCEILKDVGDKVNEDVGDGTTSAMMLAGEIFYNGMKGIISSEINRVKIIQSIDNIFSILLKELEKFREEMNFEDIEKIAYMSSRNEEISFLLMKAYEKIGTKGLITVGDSNGVESCLEVSSGSEYEIKSESVYLLDSIHLTELYDPYILVTNEKINNIRKLVPILTKVSETGRRILIISKECSDEVLKVLTLNKQKGGIKACTCKLNVAVPDKELEDLAVVTGAKYLDAVLNVDFRALKLEYLGSAEKITIKKDKLIILNGRHKKDEMNRKINELNMMAEESPSSFDREKASERLAKITGGIAVIKLGAHTDSELKEKKMRLEDALSSTMSAVKSGIVKGGCGVYVELFKELERYESEFKNEELIAYNIVKDSLKNTYMRLLDNSNLSGEVLFNEALKNEYNMVFDIFSNKFVDFREFGIIDSYLSIEKILQRSRSIIHTLLNVDTLIASVKKKVKNKR